MQWLILKRRGKEKRGEVRREGKRKGEEGKGNRLGERKREGEERQVRSGE
jgi:hypothetical protein